MNKKIIFIDIDETIFDTPQTEPRDYTKSIPIVENINKANRLYDDGHKIVYWTARGSRSGIDWYELTKKQLVEYGVKHHALKCDKPYYDLFIDDKNLNVEDWKPTLYKKGIIAGAFDLLHPGYIKTFEYAKQHCDFLVVALHEDPSVERKEKVKPLLSVEERKQALLSLQNVDEVVVYKTENELYSLLQDGDYSVRFLGDDYVRKNFTGSDLKIEQIVYVPRKHGWSYSKLLEKIKKGG